MSQYSTVYLSYQIILIGYHAALRKRMKPKINQSNQSYNIIVIHRCPDIIIIVIDDKQSNIRILSNIKKPFHLCSISYLIILLLI